MADGGAGFAGFELSRVELGEVTLRVRRGGSGPGLLLLHGYPQTHLMWLRIAPVLAEHFTVVAPDLRGYGESSKPTATADHGAHSKRAMAADGVALMRELGFESFHVIGHDRGGRVAYRMALDHPGAVRRLSVLDIVPTAEVWARADRSFALGYWHWSFLAQRAPLPETLIGADPEYFFLDAQFDGVLRGFPEEAVRDYRRALADPEVVHAICEDYRAGAGFDRELDERDRAAGATVDCPTQVLWGTQGALPAWYDPLEVWRAWAPGVVGGPVEGGHFFPEQNPADTAAALSAFHVPG
ncbi:alpha/beta fold hydrolase [Pseudonocardia humida]|uniref:Alpha/beta fold hydrolase n=1 Tax=Pseudonocardia humida TaxID=2800819 RepID=A0ABT0ZSL2_9PSEU|nr:alpha/beta fold hydrolase [Pseudonocardia humida]MCO1653727.1 alpha/beta fold hydrolase [Pseudonocardia humida]